MPRLVIHFARFGPYHLARIDAAAATLGRAGWEVIGLETGSGDTTYAWREETSGNQAWQRHTIFPGEAAELISSSRLSKGIFATLDRLRPEAVAIAGWGSVDARTCSAWCRKHGAQTIVMSETREADGRRVWWKEFLKSRIVRRFDAALVGGKSHRDYLAKLGLPANRIRFGYNVVNNEYFAGESRKVRMSVGEGRSERPYFLASNRFIERKNLARLIEAYGSYVHQSAAITQLATPWSLCLLGDGELKADLMAQCHGLGLIVAERVPWEESGPIVYFPGFRQIEELPQFYARAGCFIHPALEEPWGLVINEAMACGLPVLSSRNVGAAEELVDDGVNGWQFDATRVETIRDCLQRVSAPDFPWEAFSGASCRIVDERAPLSAFGDGLLGSLRIAAEGMKERDPSRLQR